MYAKGNQLPGSPYGGYRQLRRRTAGARSLLHHRLRRPPAEPGLAARVTSPAPWGTIRAQEIKP